MIVNKKYKKNIAFIFTCFGVLIGIPYMFYLLGYYNTSGSGDMVKYTYTESIIITNSTVAINTTYTYITNTITPAQDTSVINKKVPDNCVEKEAIIYNKINGEVKNHEIYYKCN